MSRLGLDALISRKKLSDMLIRLEFDWKGDDEKFRIRHLFLRTKHWLIGKSWSSLNNVSYQFQGIDGRFTGGAVGSRPLQVRYYNHIRKWKYQISIEHFKPSLIQPDTLGAEGTIIIPDLAGNLSYETGSFNIMVAGVLRINEVQFTSGKKGSQSQLGYGGLIAAKLHLNERNRFMLGASGGIGMGGYMGDFAFVDIDLAYNPGTSRFENMSVFVGQIGFEHDWSEQFTSSLGGSILGSEEKSFFNAGFYKSGSKILTNLFYKPVSKFGHVIVGIEIEYAERRNIATPTNNTIRASSLFVYNF
jgi:hypothetical protein